jgi:divalent metal cation (Fe/Co/Zn/Cd) transporter
MDRIIKVAGWVSVAVLGLVVWTVFPEAQTIIACLLAATLIFYVFFAAVKVTVGRLVGDQLMELQLQINAVAERLELMDRKTNALLRNALEQRQAANPRDAIGVAPKQTLAVQRRSG